MTSSPVPADRSDAAHRSLRGRLASATRRDFIRGVAAAGRPQRRRPPVAPRQARLRHEAGLHPRRRGRGASIVGAVALKSNGLDLFSEQAFARHRRNDFSEFRRSRPPAPTCSRCRAASGPTC